MKNEILTLLNKAKDSLKAAELLQHAGYYDFAVSRAYYAMFYTSQVLLLNQGLSFSSHAAVIAAFGKEFAKTNILDNRFHRYLIDAQDYRNQGDYGINNELSAKQSEDVLNWGKEFLDVAMDFLENIG